MAWPAALMAVRREAATAASWSRSGLLRRFSSEVSKPAVASSGSTEAEQARLKKLAQQRRKYDVEIAKLRKTYGAEFQKKRLEEEKIGAEQRKEIEEQRAVRVVAKKERAAARAVERAEQQSALQALVKEFKAESAQNRARMDGRQGYIRFKRKEAIRRQSSMWIEEKDLERRILDAIANPYQLAGSSGSEPADRDDSYYEADES